MAAAISASGFAGTILLLATATGLGVRHRFPQERLAWLLLVVAVAAMALPPAAARAREEVPIWQFSATEHHRLLLLVSFCMAWLGACGIERWRRGEQSRRGLLICAVSLALLLIWATWANPHPSHPEALATLRRGTLLLQLKVLLAGALLLAALARIRAGTWLLGVLVACELAILHLAANPSAPSDRWLPTPQPLASLRAVIADDRFAALGSAFPANLAALWDLADARVYNPAAPDSYRRLVAPLSGQSGGARTFTTGDHPLYDLLGVRFLLTAPDSPPLARTIRILQSRQAIVHERQGALPLLFLPPSWVPGTLPWEELATRRANYSLRAWLYGAGELAAGHGTRGQLVARKRGFARVRAGASVPTPRVFATRILQDGGWHLLVNGESRTSFLANGPLLAGALRPEDRVVDLLYRPPGFVTGALLAALGAAAALAWWLPSPRRDAWMGRPLPIDEGGL